MLLGMGEGTSGASLLVIVYTPTQHHNLMKDPLSGKVENGATWGFDEPCIFGQGWAKTNPIKRYFWRC